MLYGADNCLIEWNEFFDSQNGVAVTWNDAIQNRSDNPIIRYNLVYDIGPSNPEGGDGISVSGGSDGEVHHNICWLSQSCKPRQ